MTNRLSITLRDADVFTVQLQAPVPYGGTDNYEE